MHYSSNMHYRFMCKLSRYHLQSTLGIQGSSGGSSHGFAVMHADVAYSHPHMKSHLSGYAQLSVSAHGVGEGHPPSFLYVVLNFHENGQMVHEYKSWFRLVGLAVLTRQLPFSGQLIGKRLGYSGG